MLTQKSNITDILISIYCSFAIFLFAALSLILPSGSSYGALLLLLGSFILLIKRPAFQLHRHDWFFIAALVSYFLVNVLSNIYHHLPANFYDKPSRYLLAIPVYLLLISCSPKQYLWWFGLAFGAFGAGILAIYQQIVPVDSSSRASGFLNSIQFGDISILMSGLLISGFMGSFKNRHKIFLLFMVIACVMGLIASFLSLSRGGWIALPVMLMIFYIGSDAIIRRKILIFVVVIFTLSALAIIFLPGSSPLKGRIETTQSEINKYLHGNNQYTSVTSRIMLWNIGIDAFKEQPILGWGDLAAIKQNFPSSWEYINTQDDFNHLHNEYIDELAKKGIVGFISLMALYLIPLHYFLGFIKSKNAEVISFAISGSVLVVCVMIFGLTQCFLAHNSGTMSFVFYLVIIKAYCRNMIVTS